MWITPCGTFRCYWESCLFGRPLKCSLLHLKRLEVGLCYTETKNNIECKYFELQTYHRCINQISNRAVWSKPLLTSHFCSALKLTRLSFGELYKAAHRYLCLGSSCKLGLIPRVYPQYSGKKDFLHPQTEITAWGLQRQICWLQED